jgi:polyisoprenoid-binding protein YceI
MTQVAREIDGVSAPPAGTYEIDPGHTEVGFVARHMLTRVRGRFTEFAGRIVLEDEPERSTVEVDVLAASVQTNLDMRDNHLKSGDFFLIEEFPTITFRSTAVRLTGGAGFELDGGLTIRGITNPVTLKGELLGWGPDMEGTPMIAATARTTVDREDWDMTWNAAVETGGFLVGKKVDLEIEVEARMVADPTQ